MSSLPCVFIVANNYHNSLEAFFSSRGLKVINVETNSEAELFALPELKNVRGIVTDTRLHIRENLLDQAPNLRWIGRLGSGMEHIDVQALHSRGIFCISTPEGNSLAVAEHCLGLYLALLRRIVLANQEVCSQIWRRNENRGEQLQGKKVGIIGYGNTGKAFAKILSLLGVEVLAYDKYKRIDSDIDLPVQPASLDMIFAEADMVSLHLPLTEETHYYANLNFFQRFYKRILFINSSRGKILDTEALLLAYDKGLIRGAALDVLENEKLDKWTEKDRQIFQSLKTKPNVILTPHIAGYTFQSLEKMSALLCQKLKALGLV